MTAIDTRTESNTIVLRMPNPHPDDGRENPLANLRFGPAGSRQQDHERINIEFQEQEPGIGYAVVPQDHPLLESLFRKYPQVEIMQDGPKQVYMCAICDDGREFAGKPQLRAHMKAHGRKGTVDLADDEQAQPTFEGTDQDTEE